MLLINPIRAFVVITLLFLWVPLVTATALLDAILDNDQALAEKLVEQGANPNEFDPYDGIPPLHSAYYNGNFKLVKYLLSHGADINLYTDQQPPIIYLAVQENDIDNLKYFVKKGASIDALGRNGQTLLQLALTSLYLDISLWLIDQDIDINSNGKTVTEEQQWQHGKQQDFPIILALALVDEANDKKQTKLVNSIIASMLKKDVNLDVSNTEGKALIFSLLATKDKKIITSILAKTKQVDQKDNFENTPLHKSIKMGLTDISKKLLEQTNRFDEQDLVGYTVYHSAYEAGMFDLISMTLKKEAATGSKSSFMTNPFGKTIFHLAYLDGRTKLLEKWLKYPSSVLAVDAQGNSLLHLATRQNDSPMVKKLLAKSSDPHRLNVKDQSPLSLAVESQSIDIIKALIKRAKHDKSINKSPNLLHLAVRRGELDVVELLVDAEYKLDHKDVNGFLPLHTAINYGQPVLIDYFVDMMNEPKTPMQAVKDPFLDPRVTYWSMLYWANKKEQLIKSVEQDMAKENMSIFAPKIWTTVNDNQDVLRREYNKHSGDWSGRIELTANVNLMKAENRFSEVVSRYPPSYGFNKHDLFAIIELAYAANSLGDLSLKYDYLEVAAKLYPEFWQLAWMYENMELLNSPDFNARAKKIISSETTKDSFFANYISKLIEQPSWGSADRLQELNKWLEIYPQDTRALAAKAYALKGNYYTGEALVAAQKSLIYFPFYSNRDLVPEILLRREKAEQAARYINVVARWYDNPENDETLYSRQLRYLAEAYIDTGHKGKARELLERGLKKWPNSIRMNRTMAKLEMADKRYAHALVHTSKVIKLDADVSSSDYKRHIDALAKSGSKDLALEAGASARRKLTFIDKELFSTLLDLTIDLQKNELIEDVYKSAVEQIKSPIGISVTYVNWLSTQDRTAEAVPIIESMLNARPTNASLIKAWNDLDKKLASDQQHRNKIRAKTVRFPHSSGWWKLLADEQNADSKRIAIWQEASTMKNVPLLACQHNATLQMKAKEFKTAEKVLRKCIAALETDTGNIALSRKQSLYLYLFWLVERNAKRKIVSGELIGYAEKYLAKYRKEYGSLVNYYRYAEAISRAKNDMDEAADSLLAQSEFSKDKTSIYHDLIAEYSGQLNKLQTQGYGLRLLERNPYSKAIVNSYLHKQLLWSGSPINALKAIEGAKEKGVEYSRRYERRAYSELGDTVKLYENYRISGQIPGVSQRYVNWFESARSDVLAKQRKEIILDFKDGQSKVDIVMPNGEIVSRYDHPVFGVITHYQKGATYIDMKYNENGNLAAIEDSSGESVRLQYDHAGSINRMIDSKQRVLEFAYNENRKPILINMLGVGRIYISYDSAGEIKRVESEDGHRMAMQVTQAFQDLLKLTRRVEQVHRLDKIPSFANKDEKLTTLRAAFGERKPGSKKSDEAKLALASYLTQHVTDNSNYFNEANQLLVELYSSALNQSKKSKYARAVTAIQWWHKLVRKVKPQGLPPEDYSLWSEMRVWLAGVSFENKSYRKILNELDQEPLALLKDAQWLARSDIKNTGFWRRFGNEDIYSSELKQVEKQTVLIRANGDILIGTNKGLSVFRSGFWEWFGYDESLSRFDHNTAFSSLGNTSNILSLTETDDQILWVGTANGLFAIEGDYQRKVKRWQTNDDGLASPRINSLRSNGNSVYLADAKSLATIDDYQQSRAKTLSTVSGITDFELIQDYSESTALIILNGQQMLLLDGDKSENIAEKVSLMKFDKQSNRLYWLASNRLYNAQLSHEKGHWLVSDAKFMGQKNDWLLEKEVRELNIWNVSGEGDTLVVNTDRGINILKDYYFQSMALPFEVSRGGLQLGPRLSTTGNNSDIVALTSEGLYLYQASSIRQETIGRVYDTLTDNDLGIVYVATGKDIYYIDTNSETEELRRFSSINAKYLRFDNEGNLISNDNNRIVRFTKGESTPQQLFDTQQNVDKSWQGNLNDIFVDDKNTIWAASGSSVFQLAESMKEPEEFNYFLDPEKFPSRSEMIYRIFQNIEGNIQVVASNESHLNHKGVSLAGGLLEWKNGVFKNLGRKGVWFVTGYTKIDDSTAILGTNSGFARDKNGQKESFLSLNDPTYTQMNQKSSMIWLGQKGVQLGDKNTWLFPSAAGVVVYHEGQWFYPDKLNQLLPSDQALGIYGARVVHTVSTDKNNKVYVGTDLGLLVYESNGVASLLNDNHRGQVAFVDFDTQHQQQVKDLFLTKIDANSKQGKLVTKFQGLEEEIGALEIAVSGNAGDVQSVSNKDGGEDANSESRFDPKIAEQLKKKLRAKERSRQKLLANLEKNHYGLFQMLKMDPREISAMHEKLSDKQALVQYLPTKDKLLIQVLTKSGAIIRQVDIGKELLDKMSLESATILRQQSDLLEGNKSEARGIKVKTSEKSLSLATITSESHIEHLSWLYHHLIRPIENDLVGKEQVFITPVGALTYVPFSALIRKVTPRVEYLVEKYNIGILPSMYHFNLVMHHSESYSDKGLFIADPDGSLPGARKEVSQIANTFEADKKVLQGSSASFSNFNEELEDSSIIHFATHGVLNTSAPMDSYLLLAKGYQFSVIDISTLDLEQTDLVVLSACESGIGNLGMEYATLARAFAHAKVPTVAASFWMVHDDATKDFMTHFYSQLQDQDIDYFKAMSNAKKKMINARYGYSHPAAWASFEIFGKP